MRGQAFVMEVVAQSTSNDLTGTQYTIHCSIRISVRSTESELRQEHGLGGNDSPRQELGAI